MQGAQRTGERILHDLDTIPTLASEAEEAVFWDDHQRGADFLERMGPLPADVLPPARSRAVAVDVQLGADTLRRLRALAGRHHVGLLTLIARFVTERLAEEERRDEAAEGHQGRDG